jgi:hypothetical protein
MILLGLGRDMAGDSYLFTVTAEDQAAAGRSATALADTLRELEGVLEADRSKGADLPTMDLGAVVSVIASSAATVAIAQGVAAWLRARRGVNITIEKNSKSASIRTAVSGIDPVVATRIVELIRG